MNEVLKAIHNRRSIRSYGPRQLAEKDLWEILKAAIVAPNGMNQQKWHFSVIQDKALLDKMVDIIKENVLKSGNEFLIQRVKSPGYHTFYHAPTLVLISADKQADFTHVDCGAAAQNIALAAESLGIGSCLIASSGLLFASREGEQMSSDLGIPDGYQHIISVALGYADADRPAMPHRNEDVFSHIE